MGVAVEPFTLPKSISISIEVNTNSCLFVKRPKTFLQLTDMTMQVVIYIFKQPEEKKRKKETFELEPELDDFHPNISIKLELDPQGDRPVRACRTQQGNKDPLYSGLIHLLPTNQFMSHTVFVMFHILCRE